MNAQLPRRKEILTPDMVNTRRDSETMERELIFGLTKSYRFYREVREVLCPFDKVHQCHRRDFTVGRYNELYRAIDSFYRRFESQPIPANDFFIPPVMLAAHIIDWGNKLVIADDVARQLSKEIVEEIPLAEAITREHCSALIQSPAFKDWLNGRVLDHAMAKLSGQQQLGKLTLPILRDTLDKVDRHSGLLGGQHGTARTLGEIPASQPDDPDVLLKPGRAFCRGFIGLIVGGTGLGKSTLVMQMLIQFAMGEPCFEIKPTGPLKVLLIQAENDDGDVAEMRDGVFKGLQLNTMKRRLALDAIRVMPVDDVSGEDFVKLVVDRQLALHKPDIVVIDPVLAYVGGAVNEQEKVSSFLRQQLLPVIRRHNCGCLLIHHTNKPAAGRDKNQMRSPSDLAYAGSGSAEFANVARIIFNLTSTPTKGVYELSVSKRGTRLGWKDNAGMPTTRKFIRHHPEPGTLCWLEATESEVEQTAKKGQKDTQDVKSELLKLIPETGIEQKDLLEQAKAIGIGQKKVTATVNSLLAENEARKEEVSRKGARPAIRYSRMQAPGVRNNGFHSGRPLLPGCNQEEITQIPG